MIHDLSLLAMCTTVSFFMSYDVRLPHLNKDYLLTYFFMIIFIYRNGRKQSKGEKNENTKITKIALTIGRNII